MIIRINNKENKIAKEIHAIFQESYTVEADILKAIDFPPLRRTVSQILNSNSKFYAYYVIKRIAGVIEIEKYKDLTHIQSLVVYPRYFRRGIGNKLVQFILKICKSKTFTVETGIDNYPALQLYRRWGFQEQEQWDTDHGIRKIRFKKRI